MSECQIMINLLNEINSRLNEMSYTLKNINKTLGGK